jgi:hypothetical protein
LYAIYVRDISASHPVTGTVSGLRRRRFSRLSPAGQSAFLEKQGYATLETLLAHVLAWWLDGERVVEQMRADPSMPLGDYDVDEFNAAAVRQAAGLDEAYVLRRYEDQRQKMVELDSSLTDDQLSQGNINTRLYYEIIGHWNEHRLD